MVKNILKDFLYRRYSKFKNYKSKVQSNELEEIMELLNQDKDYYYTYAKRPRCTDEISYRSPSYSSSKIGIVIQGQIIVKDHFTLETVKLYHKLYPECPIIVSTWNDEDEQELEQIGNVENTYIVKSDYPEISGHGHINYQRLNSMNGILKAGELGCEYVLKNRADQRLYANNVILYLKTLVDRFPLTIKCNAKGRIAVCSLSTMKNRLYNICDMLLFGYTEDMLKYFSPKEAPYYPKDTKVPDERLHPVEYAKIRQGEIYFATNYIENCGFELKWTFEDSDYYRNNLFIIFDTESVDQFWPKYGSKEYLWRSYTSYPHEMATFEDWLVHQEVNNS